MWRFLLALILASLLAGPAASALAQTQLPVEPITVDGVPVYPMLYGALYDSGLTSASARA